MILFILIFFTMIIAVGIASVVGFSNYLKQRRQLPQDDSPRQLENPPPYRSLFEPTDDEIRLQQREDYLRKQADEKASRQEQLKQKAAAVRKELSAWLGAPDKSGAVRVILEASGSESARVYSEIAESVIKVVRENRVPGLGGNELAELLDSHFRLLPQQERNSGELHWLKNEITALSNNPTAP
jgi:hypothetical protein